MSFSTEYILSSFIWRICYLSGTTHTSNRILQNSLFRKLARVQRNISRALHLKMSTIYNLLFGIQRDDVRLHTTHIRSRRGTAVPEISCPHFYQVDIAPAGIESSSDYFNGKRDQRFLPSFVCMLPISRFYGTDSSASLVKMCWSCGIFSVRTGLVRTETKHTIFLSLFLFLIFSLSLRLIALLQCSRLAVVQKPRMAGCCKALSSLSLFSSLLHKHFTITIQTTV